VGVGPYPPRYSQNIYRSNLSKASISLLPFVTSFSDQHCHVVCNVYMKFTEASWTGPSPGQHLPLTKFICSFLEDLSEISERAQMQICLDTVYAYEVRMVV
jgi:hypothetical protein